MGTNYRSVISDIAVLRPDSAVLLPNLTKLSWTYDHGDLWRESIFFMHKGIRNFSLFLQLGEPETYETILQYFEQVATRMPHLQGFYLNLLYNDATASQAHIGPALSWLLPKLRSLKVLKVPPILDLYDVISSTASLPNLETIDASVVGSLFPRYPPTSNVTLPRGLQSLSLGISYSEAATYLLCTEFPVMTKLSLWSHKPESQISTRTLTRAIALRCKSLRDISLTANTADGLELLTDGRITLADIQPLFGCRSVVRFSITHVLPLHLTNSDIRNLLTNRSLILPSMIIRRTCCCRMCLNHIPTGKLWPLSPSMEGTWSVWVSISMVLQRYLRV